MGKLIVPDTIFANPLANDYPSLSTIDSSNIQGGRLMSDAPHIDGLLIAGAGALAKNSANLVLTRNGAGDWSLNRTSAGAETYFVRAVMGDMGAFIRTGELYEVANSVQGTNKRPKGIEIVDFFVLYSVGVVALTTLTLRLGKTVYKTTVGGAAPTQTDLVAATGIPTATNTAYLYADVAGPSPLVFSVDDLSLVEIELNAVMANTGTLAIAAIGAHCNFNFN